MNNEIQEANIEGPQIIDLYVQKIEITDMEPLFLHPAGRGLNIDQKHTLTYGSCLRFRPESTKNYKWVSIFSSQGHRYWQILFLLLLSGAWASISIHSTSRWLIFTQNAGNALYQTANQEIDMCKCIGHLFMGRNEAPKEQGHTKMNRSGSILCITSFWTQSLSKSREF